MKNRMYTILCKIKEVIKSAATNIAAITQELYAVDREVRIAQISERKRRTVFLDDPTSYPYKVFLLFRFRC